MLENNQDIAIGMKERINDKINQIEKFIDELSPLIPEELDVYKRDIGIKAACERYIEKIILSLVDLVFLVIRYKKLRMPEDEESAFEIIKKEKIITNELCERLKNAKRMRNIIVHQYGEIDDEIVFGALKEELFNDARELTDSVGRIL